MNSIIEHKPNGVLQSDMQIYVDLTSISFTSLDKIESLRGSECISEHLRTVGFLGADPRHNGERLRASYLLRNIFRGKPFFTLTCLKYPPPPLTRNSEKSQG